MEGDKVVMGDPPVPPLGKTMLNLSHFDDLTARFILRA